MYKHIKVAQLLDASYKADAWHFTDKELCTIKVVECTMLAEMQTYNSAIGYGLVDY